MVMDEITEEPGALVERVAALDIGKATLTACVRVPHEGKPGARRQEVRTYAKAQGFDVVLSTEGVVYAAPAYDVTPAILTALQARNAAAPATAPPAAKPAPPAKPQPH